MTERAEIMAVARGAKRTENTRCETNIHQKRKVGEVGMRIHEMTISMVADNGLMPVTVTHNSPKRIVSGARVRFGWFFIRIGAIILYGKEWEGR